MEKKLFIIDSYPTEKTINQISRRLDTLDAERFDVSVFLLDYGVFWLLDESWDLLFRNNIFYYAHAHDAEKYSIPFREEVVFSGMPALRQLLNTSENISRLEEDRIFPEPLLTDKS